MPPGGDVTVALVPPLKKHPTSMPATDVVIDAAVVTDPDAGAGSAPNESIADPPENAATIIVISLAAVAENVQLAGSDDASFQKIDRVPKKAALVSCVQPLDDRVAFTP